MFWMHTIGSGYQNGLVTVEKRGRQWFCRREGGGVLCPEHSSYDDT